MAQVLAPGVAQMNLSGVHGAQPWSVILHWAWPNITQAWTLTDIQALADAGRSAWAANLAAHCATGVNLTSVQTVDIGSSTAVVGNNTTAVPGTGAGGAVANSAMCALMSFTIASRYKGGHPRAYLPCGTNTDVLNEASWNTAFVTAMNTAWTGFANGVSNGMSQIGGQNCLQSVARYKYDYVEDAIHHKFHKVRTSYVGTFPVNGHKLASKFGTQRRRLAI